MGGFLSSAHSGGRSTSHFFTTEQNAIAIAYSLRQKLLVASAKTQLLRASAKSIASAKNAIAYSLRQN